MTEKHRFERIADINAASTRGSIFKMLIFNRVVNKHLPIIPELCL